MIRPGARTIQSVGHPGEPKTERIHPVTGKSAETGESFYSDSAHAIVKSIVAIGDAHGSLGRISDLVAHGRAVRPLRVAILPHPVAVPFRGLLAMSTAVPRSVVIPRRWRGRSIIIRIAIVRPVRYHAGNAAHRRKRQDEAPNEPEQSFLPTHVRLPWLGTIAAGSPQPGILSAPGIPASPWKDRPPLTTEGLFNDNHSTRKNTTPTTAPGPSAQKSTRVRLPA